jgi:16S rRNA (guanine527-N7)-methyltransferase
MCRGKHAAPFSEKISYCTMHPMDIALKARLEQLNEVFLLENQKLNLSSLRDPKQCWIGNILDSLPLLHRLDALFPIKQESYALLDIGTGGGFPLLPLAIARSDLHCTGLDATRKKVDAVDRIVSALALTNVKLITGRSEEVAYKPQYRQQFDIVTARAVAPLNVLLELCAPFARLNGILVFWKSMHIADEQRASLSAAKALGCELVETHRYELPEGFGERQLLIYRKTAPTDRRYPRDVGIPKKEPL